MRQSELRVAIGKTGLALIAAMLLLAAGQVSQAGSGPTYVASEYIIHCMPGTKLPVVEAAVQNMGCELVRALALDDTYLVKMNRSARAQAKSFSGASSGRAMTAWVIDRVQPNYLKKFMSTPGDPMWDKLWGMKMIKMPAAWDLQKGSGSVVVSVNDSGVAPHPDLVNRLLPGYDAGDNDTDAAPDVNGVSHGTHVAGTIAAQGDNGIGVVGVCWDGVKILPVKLDNAAGQLTTAAIINGLDYSLNQQADVVNMSYGGYYDDQAEHSKLQELYNAGIILVAAAGNDSTSIPSYPAGYSEVVSVAALGPYEAPASYTNFGKVDIAAPGGDQSFGQDGGIWSTVVTWPGGIPTYGYEAYQGTSMACPHVAGACALLISNGVPRGEVVDRLLRSARPPKSGGMDALYYGAGIMDVYAALTNTVLRIVEPTKGSNTTSKPHFRVNLRGIDLSSVKVYLDYTDLDDDGKPDNPSEAQIINTTNVNYFWDASTNMLEFDWLDSDLHLPQAADVLAPGFHNIYVSGVGTTGGATVSDWATFYVVTRTFKKGIHMVSFPYPIADRMLKTPADILRGAQFGPTARPKSSLIRWIAAPRSCGSTVPIGYQTYVPDSLSDQTWVTPSYVCNGQTVLLGGGTYQNNDPIDSAINGVTVSASPVGSGFWLILPEDVAVDETFPVLESQANFDSSKGFDISLYAGWNLIGNPYGHQVPWRAALFTYQGRTMSLLDAESAGWVRSTMYGYGGSGVGYVRVSERDSLEPFSGYWLLALVGGTDPTTALRLTLLP